MREMGFDQLDYVERSQLAWAILWPTLILVLLVWGPRDNLGLTTQQLDEVDSWLSIILLFLVWPWAVRRAVRVGFPRFHLFVLRPSGGETRSMKYSESLRVAWLLIWRIGAILAAVGGLIYGAVWLAQGSRPDIPFQQHVAHPGLRGLGKELFEDLWGGALLLVILVIWMLKAAFNKEYSNFRLRLASA